MPFLLPLAAALCCLLDATSEWGPGGDRRFSPHHGEETPALLLTGKAAARCLPSNSNSSSNSRTCSRKLL